MGLFDSILFPLSNKNFLRHHDFTLINAFHLSCLFSSRLHFIAPAIVFPHLQRKLVQVKKKDRTYIIHESAGHFFQDISNTIDREEVSLVLLGSDPVSFFRVNGHLTWEQEFIQDVQVPILVCPVTFNLARNPIESLLVPLSGEVRINAALKLALCVANQQKIPIDLIHVTTPSDISVDSSALGHLSDHFYYEYPQLINRLISESCPFSSLRERRLVREFWHCYGDEAGEILKHSERKKTGLIILEWKGTLLSGHAAILKSILTYCDHPILLVRESCQGVSLLKVGREFRAA